MKMRILLPLSLLLGVSLAAAQQTDDKKPDPAAPAAQTTPAQPSLADIARQNRANKAKKVYTDEDMPKSADSSANGSVVDSSAPPPKDSAAASTKDAGATDKTDGANGKEAASDKDKEQAEKDKAEADRIAFLKKDQQTIDSQIDMFRKRIENETIESRKATWQEVIETLTKQKEKQQAELDQLSSKKPAPQQ